MKRVLISGGSGFVGANLTRRLLDDGHETHLLLRPSHQSWRLAEVADDVQLHYGHVENRAEVGALMRAIRPDWVFHLAAFGAYSTQTGIERMIATNLMGCVSVLDACVEVGVGAFVQTGSSSEYGLKDHPTTESEHLEPNSHYAITKAAATHYCRHVALHHDVNAVTVRLYSIYGPFEEPTRLIPNLILSGLRGELPPLASPRTARDFVYVEDAVSAIIQVAAAASIDRGAVYNVASGLQSSLADVVAIARRLMGIVAEPRWATMKQRSWDSDVWIGSPDRIEHEIGWHPVIGLDAGLGRTVEWFPEQSRVAAILYGSNF